MSRKSLIIFITISSLLVFSLTIYLLFNEKVEYIYGMIIMILEFINLVSSLLLAKKEKNSFINR